MQNVKRLVAAVLLLMLMLSLAWAAPQPVEKKATKDRSAQPITVKSDQLQAYNEAKQAVFTGRVVARQDDVTIYSDRLEVYYGESDDEVDKIIASGNVRILQTNRVGTGGHAVYESKLGKITLTENPRVSQDTDTVTGKVIIYYLDEERSEVQSGDNARVEAVIHPKSGNAPKKSDKKHDANKQ
jgi:lipopolysaccharide export system protein LptA